MINKPDLDRIKRYMRDCSKYYVYGSTSKIASFFSEKRSDVCADSDLIIIDENDPILILNFMKTVTHDCSIIILDYTNPNLVSCIQKYMDENCTRYQYSRQMLVDSIKEKSILIRHSNSVQFHDRTDPITIFLVLKTGGPVYNSAYVNATATNIRKHITYHHEIVCITDNHTGISEVDRVIKMRHNWPKWWGKVELFREDLTKNSHCMFMDLDTVCINNIDFLCKASDGFYGLRDFYTLDTFQTGLMKWDLAEADKIYNIYRSFLNVDISKYMNKGDHEWIGSAARHRKFLQDAFPGEICSYKKHLAHIHRSFMNPSIVCFHGDPRPHTVKDNFVIDNWKLQ